MSEKFSLMGLESVESKYLDGRSVATCSEATGAELDREVLSIIESCHDRAIELLEKTERHSMSYPIILLPKKQSAAKSS